MIADFQDIKGKKDKNKEERSSHTLVKQFHEYSQDYQMYAQAGFLVWKLIALIYYSDLKLEDYSFVRLDKIAKETKKLADSSLSDSSDEEAAKKRL